jgi:hypothetical protein
MSATGSSSSNTLSWRAINLAEVVSVVLSILLVEWALAPFAVSVWLLVARRFSRSADAVFASVPWGNSSNLGFGGRYFERALLLLAGPTLLAIAALDIRQLRNAIQLHLPGSILGQALPATRLGHSCNSIQCWVLATGDCANFSILIQP